jgi:uncharacterized protein (DUF2147 family)
MKKLSITPFILLLTLINAFGQKTKGNQILGAWLSEDKDVKVEIYKSGDHYFGKLVWGKEMYEADGKTSRKDVENKDQKLRSRNLKDLIMLSNFTYHDDVWDGGEIYDPRNGSTYNCILKLKDDRLDIRGYIGISLFGKTTVWERVQ